MSFQEKIFSATEKTILIIIGIFTVTAVYQEIAHIIEIGSVKLGDLLLLFLYLEVIGMLGIFYKYRKIPITVPVYIAITALCRMMILDGKTLEPIELISEASAVLLLGLAVYLIQKTPDSQPKE